MTLRLLTLLCLPGLLSAAFAPQQAPPVGLAVNGEVDRVVDGDTLDVRVSMIIRVRLQDCWAAETRTKDQAEKRRGLAAKQRMVELTDGKSVRVFIPGRLELKDMLTLDRALGRVWALDSSGNPVEPDLSAVMVREGHATATKRGAE